uniref:SH3 domain-containing protein n=1 Tax=viral metagenome TaxID=1070528 RepID=A0A6C0EYW7_9ZZZZ
MQRSRDPAAKILYNRRISGPTDFRRINPVEETKYIETHGPIITNSNDTIKIGDLFIAMKDVISQNSTYLSLKSRDLLILEGFHPSQPNIYKMKIKPNYEQSGIMDTPVGYVDKKNIRRTTNVIAPMPPSREGRPALVITSANNQAPPKPRKRPTPRIRFPYKYRALYDYIPETTNNEIKFLNIKAGDILLSQFNDASEPWIMVQNSETQMNGYVPTSYVELISSSGGSRSKSKKNKSNKSKSKKNHRNHKNKKSSKRK